MLKRKFLLKILLVPIIGFSCFQINKLEAIIPYYDMPTKNYLRENGSLFAQKAYLLLSLGQFEKGLSLANLAITLDNQNENNWAILAEAQIRNNLMNDALISIEKGKLLNPKMGDFYFVEGSIYMQQNNLKKSKLALIKGLEFKPESAFVLFQLGNIFLMEKNYNKALIEYEKAIKIKSDFWQVINNKGLAFYEKNQKLQAIENFNKAIAIKRDGETLLALAVSLQNNDIKKSVNLAKEALKLNPNFVSKEYRKSQLWGDKLQNSTEKLFKIEELSEDIIFAEEVQLEDN